MSYARDGFVIVRQAINPVAIDEFDRNVIGLVEEWTGKRFENTREPAFAEFLINDRELERRLYDGVRNFAWLKTLSLSPELIETVSGILGPNIGLFSKIPLRLDLPRSTRELAVWHQDYWYVKGNENVVTLWMPLQDTSYLEGCLMVMPGSHELGPLHHDGEALGKRHYPKGIFDREVRYVEMKRGDILLFHSLLLHSSGMNISDRARLSIQARYTRLDEKADPGMGDVIPVREMAQ